MAEGNDRQQWDYLSHILWFLYEINRDPDNSETKIPANFNPYRQDEKPKPIMKTSDLSFLKQLCKGGE